jgi:hypothetical protein
VKSTKVKSVVPFSKRHLVHWAADDLAGPYPHLGGAVRPLDP